MLFHAYSQINPPNAKNIKKLSKYRYFDPNIEWVLMEKIHGANFSFIINSDNESNVMCAKRTGIIRPDEHFFNYELIKEKYESDAKEIYRRLKEKLPGLITVNIYGELFGGTYPGMKSVTSHIQKGIYYSPEIDFLVFDIRVIIRDPHKTILNYFLAHDDVIKYMVDLKLKSVPIRARGNYNALSKESAVFESEIYKLYDLPYVSNNYAEGYVLKANMMNLGDNCRSIIKLKNEAIFGEILNPNKFQPKSNQISYIHEHFIKIVPYCTENRFITTISKLGTDVEFPKLVGFFIADAVDDYQKNFNDDDLLDFEKNSKKIKNKLNKHIKNTCIKWLESYLEPAQTHVEQVEHVEEIEQVEQVEQVEEIEQVEQVEQVE